MSAATVLDVVCSPIVLDPRQNPPVAPPRAAPYRSREFDRRRDALTLLADIFRDETGAVRAVGPPAGPRWRQPGVLRAACAASGQPCEVEMAPHRNTLLAQHYRFRPAPTSGGLLVSAAGQQEARAVQPYLGAWFAGRRVLMAVVCDNRLEWVADWARFHQVHHGVDAVLLFDNRSTAYAGGDLARTVAAVPGIAVVAVVPWAMAYGSLAGRLGWRRSDVFHGQVVAFALAQRRLLPEAAWVLSVDIDELVAPLAGRTIDDLFADPEPAWASFPLQDLRGDAADPPDGRRHRDVLLSTGPPTFERPKWAAVPARCPDGSSWGIHVVGGARAVRADPAEFVIAHCLSLTTGWEGRGDRRVGLRRDAPGVAEETEIGLRMAGAFDGWESRPVIWSPGGGPG